MQESLLEQVQSPVSEALIGHGPHRRPPEEATESPDRLARRIRAGLRRHLDSVGLATCRDGTLVPKDVTKEGYRKVHNSRRIERLLAEGKFIARNWPLLRRYFADGLEVNPAEIQPKLELVKAGSWQANLFRLASLTWSVPVSQGYGRRLRFLVWDASNGRLLGLVALGDPVFNLRVRDAAIGWSGRYRCSRLVNVMDAYVLGAIPPYNEILGGKLVACLVQSKEMRDAFRRRYSNRRGVISQRRKRAALVLVTTTSALGKSSMLDRLRLGDKLYFRSVGFTEGWGHFHLPDSLFSLMRQYLAATKHRYASGHRFGDGPNWKLRAARQVLNMVGINDNLLSHGIRREVFLCWLATNGREVLTRKDYPIARFDGLLSIAEISKLAKQRWIVPRAVRRPEFRSWSRDLLAESLGLVHGMPASLESAVNQEEALEVLAAG